MMGGPVFPVSKGKQKVLIDLLIDSLNFCIGKSYTYIFPFIPIRMATVPPPPSDQKRKKIMFILFGTATKYTLSNHINSVWGSG